MKLYDIIYADPPWEYDNKKIGKNNSGGVKYKTLSLNDLCNLDIPAKNNSILFLWAVAPMLKESFHLMDQWGFKYKTILVWDKKINNGMGYWFRGRVEFLLLGTKGKIKPFKLPVPNFHSETRSKHSRKPGQFRKIIELLPYKDRLEMFARRGNTEGWDLFGYEAERSIIIKNKTK